MIKQTYSFKVFTILLFVVSSYMSIGCDKNSPGPASQATADSIKASAQAIESSRQNLHLTDKERQQAGTSSASRLANQVANRIDQQVDYSEIEQALSKLSQQLAAAKASQTPPDESTLNDMTQKIISTSRSFLARQAQLDNKARTENMKQLKAAEQQLKQAIALASKDNKTAQIGPELMLGTINLFIAREGLGRLRQQEQNNISERIALCSTANAVAVEQAFYSGVQSFLPDKTEAAIDARLAGTSEQTAEPSSLVQQLSDVEGRIAELAQQRQALQDQIASQRKAMEQLTQRYESLVGQAENTRDDKQYQLFQEAYALQTGSSESEGIIAYEAQIATKKSKLASIETYLDYYQLRQEQLKKLIAEVKTTVEQLKQSPIIGRVEQGRQTSQSRRSQWVAAMLGHLDSLDKAEQQYRNSRLEVIENFTQARSAYERAGKVSRGMITTHKYAQDMAVSTSKELASFWQDDAAHFSSLIEFLKGLEPFPEIKSRIDTLQGQYEQQRQDALKSSEQLQNETQAVSG